VSEDGYRLDPPEITAASQAFAGQRETPTRLAGTLEGARAVDTGDPALSGSIQGMVRQLVTALNGLAAGLGQDAAGLTQMVDAYQSRESTEAGGYGGIESRLTTAP
jgi:hypothetical protein